MMLNMYFTEKLNNVNVPVGTGNAAVDVVIKSAMIKITAVFLYPAIGCTVIFMPFFSQCHR